MTHECLLCKEVANKYYEETKNTFFKCENCDIIFKSSQNFLVKSELKKRYQNHINTPEDIHYKNFLNTLLNPLKKYLKPNDVGLDYGCGPGPTVSHILDSYKINNYDYIFFDKPELLKLKYDFVISTEVVEHFTEPLKSWDLLTSLVKPHGILGVMTEFYNGQDFSNWYYKNDPTHVVFYSHKTAEYLSQKLNLKILELEKRFCIFRK